MRDKLTTEELQGWIAAAKDRDGYTGSEPWIRARLKLHENSSALAAEVLALRAEIQGMKLLYDGDRAKIARLEAEVETLKARYDRPRRADREGEIINHTHGG